MTDYDTYTDIIRRRWLTPAEVTELHSILGAVE